MMTKSKNICLIWVLLFAYFSFYSYPIAQASHDIYVQNYKYPFKKTFQSSTAMALSKPNFTFGLETRELTLHPERNNLDVDGVKNAVQVSWFPGAANNSPLIFIIPGLGGSAKSDSSLYVGDLFAKKGYGVLIFPSTMSASFSLAVSSTGLPGYGSQDGKDMYQLMKKVYREIKKEDQLNPREIYILGYSLGAFDAAYVVNQDLKEKYFNFTKVLLLNPPYSLSEGVQTLDSLLLPGKNYSQEYQQELINDVKMSLLFYFLMPFNTDSLVQKMADIELSEGQISWFIGKIFRFALKEIILVSQEIYDLGILKKTVRKSALSHNTREASDFSFSDYQHLFLSQYYKDSNMERTYNVLKVTDLIDHWNQHNLKWAIFHNENDFIWNPELGNYLEQNSEHSRIYPLGGHLGNLWVSQNQRDLFQFFSK